MRKMTVMLFLSFILLVVTSTANAEDTQFDFKNARWDMTKTDVIVSEINLPAGETDEQLYYRPDFFSDPF